MTQIRYLPEHGRLNYIMTGFDRIIKKHKIERDKSFFRLDETINYIPLIRGTYNG